MTRPLYTVNRSMPDSSAINSSRARKVSSSWGIAASTGTSGVASGVECTESQVVFAGTSAVISVAHEGCASAPR